MTTVQLGCDNRIHYARLSHVIDWPQLGKRLIADTLCGLSNRTSFGPVQYKDLDGTCELCVKRYGYRQMQKSQRVERKKAA